MSSLLKLYDISSKSGIPFSPNVWKIRLTLNYKNVLYKTRWTSYPNITLVLESAGCPPTRTVDPLYTVPAIVDGDTKLSDSSIIVDYLEEKYPTFSVFPNGSKGAQAEYIDAIQNHIFARMAFIVFPSAVRCFEDNDLKYYIESRKRIFGVAIEDMFPEEKREAMLTELEKGLSLLASIIEGPGIEQGSGVDHGNGWLFGTSATYADFTLLGFFLWLKEAGPPGVWDRIQVLNGGIWGGLYKVAKPYMTVQ